MAVEDINVIIEDANETVSVTVNEITEEVTVIVNDFSVSKIVSQTITDGVTDKAPSEDAVHDALAGKSDLNHTHTASQITDFESASQSAVVVQTVTDGDTNHSPSSDVVFEALALKEDKANKENTVTGNETSTTKYPSIKAVVDWVISFFTPKSRKININGNNYDFSQDREWRVAQADTGVLEFGGLSYNSSTAINIGAVKGYVVDNETDPLNPSYVYIDYPGQIGVAVPTLGSGIGTIVSIIPDGFGGGTLQFQNTFPTSAERKFRIWLGKIGHPTGVITTPTAVINEPDYITSPQAFARDLFQVLGPYINDGVYASANGVNLNINVTGGNIHGNGINFVNSKIIPNEIQTGPFTPLSFLYRTQTGAGGGLVSLVDPTNYDLGGAITPVGGGVNTSTIQWIFCVPSSGFIIQYGQNTYASLVDAIAAIGQESNFVVYSNLVNNAILIGVLAVKRTCTNLSNTSDARFFRADKLGQITGAQAGISTGTLQTAYNNSLIPQIITSIANGALTVRRGSSADSDNVFVIQNGAGSNTLSATGNGDLTANSFIKTEGTGLNVLKDDGTTAALSSLGSTSPKIYTLTSANLATQDITGFLTWLNALNPNLVIAANEFYHFHVTDTGQKLFLAKSGVMVGLGQTAIVSGDVLELEKSDIFLNTIHNKRKQWWISNAGTAVLQKIGFNYPEIYTGTAINNDTGVFSSRRRTTRESSAVAGSSAEIRTGNDSVAFFSTQYGFEITLKFNFSGASGMAHFTGIISSTTTTGNVEPSTLLNCIGVGFDSTDTNLQIMHNDSAGVCTKIDLGSNFPIVFTDDNSYELVIKMTPSATQQQYIFRQYKKLFAGTTPNATLDKEVTGTINTNTILSAANGGHSWRCWSGNRALATAVRCSISEVIVETNW